MPDNYSEKVNKALAGIKIGERISIAKGKQTYEGLFMPRSDIGDDNCIVLKLDSGDNIGIRLEGKVNVKRLASKEKKKETAGSSKADFDPRKPSVGFIVTGGTIISRVDYKTGGVAPLQKTEELSAKNLKKSRNIVSLASPSSNIFLI